MRALLFLGGGILIGVGLTYTEAHITTEARMQEEFTESLESHKRVLQTAAEDFLNRESDGPFETEEELNETEAPVMVGGDIVMETKVQEVGPGPEYLKAARDYTTAIGDASGVIPLEYISEDDYNEDDGRSKEQILIHMSIEGDPLFMNEGIVLENWKELISPNILVDMYQMIPPNQETKVLYVRNHIVDTDYEVIQEFP